MMTIAEAAKSVGKAVLKDANGKITEPSTKDTIGERLARALELGSEATFYEGADAFAKLFGGTRIHLTVLLRDAGAGNNPLGVFDWDNHIEAVWNRLSEEEELPDLRDQDLWGIYLEHADLTEIDLEGTELNWCNMAHTILTNANLRETGLQGVRLRHADLDYADLTGARMIGADLRHTSLFCANLNETDLTDANLYKSVMAGASLNNARLIRTLMDAE